MVRQQRGAQTVAFGGLPFPLQPRLMMGAKDIAALRPVPPAIRGQELVTIERPELHFGLCPELLVRLRNAVARPGMMGSIGVGRQRKPLQQLGGEMQCDAAFVLRRRTGRDGSGGQQRMVAVAVEAGQEAQLQAAQGSPLDTMQRGSSAALRAVGLRARLL